MYLNIFFKPVSSEKYFVYLREVICMVGSSNKFHGKEIQIWKKKRYLKKIFENWPKCCGDVKQIPTEFPKDLLTKSNNFAYVFPKAYTLLHTSIDILKISHKKGMVVENGGRTIT